MGLGSIGLGLVQRITSPDLQMVLAADEGTVVLTAQHIRVDLGAVPVRILVRSASSLEAQLSRICEASTCSIVQSLVAVPCYL
jgi:hypothetical protein